MIKYYKNKYNGEGVLYKKRFLLPGPFWWFSIPASAIVWSLFKYNPAQYEGWMDFLHFILVIVAGGLFLLATIILFYAMDEGEGEMFFFWKIFNPQPLPKSFDKQFIKDPRYQEALQEHFNGFDIGSMEPLNKALREEQKNIVESAKESSTVIADLVRGMEMSKDVKKIRTPEDAQAFNKKYFPEEE